MKATKDTSTGNTPQSNRTPPLPYLPPIHQPSPLQHKDTHTTHLTLHYAQQDDKCQHSHKDPWLPLTHIATSSTLSPCARTPLVPLPTSPPLSATSKWQRRNERIDEFEPSRRNFSHLSRIFWNSFHVSCNIFPAKPRHDVWGSLR